MNEFIEGRVRFTWPEEMRASYDVVILGGGGHGLATAYYLATRHGITDVAVFERGYIGSGNSGRNTTVIRANYGVPESVRFYQHSLDLYRSLEEETGRWIMHAEKGLLWIAHTEMGLRAERARAALNQAYGSETVFVGPGGDQEDLPPDRPVGWRSISGARGLLSPEGSDRSTRSGGLVAGRGGHESGSPHPPTDSGEGPVDQRRSGHWGRDRARTGGRRDGVDGAWGARSARWRQTAGVRLPIRTHPLQAFVTNHYQGGFDTIVASTELLFYASQTARGEMLIGAEVDRQPSYSYRSSYGFLSSCAGRSLALLPFLGGLRPSFGSGPGCATCPRITRRSWALPGRRDCWSPPDGAPGASRRFLPAVKRWPP